MRRSKPVQNETLTEYPKQLFSDVFNDEISLMRYEVHFPGLENEQKCSDQIVLKQPLNNRHQESSSQSYEEDSSSSSEFTESETNAEPQIDIKVVTEMFVKM